jgi:hypothetical protein
MMMQFFFTTVFPVFTAIFHFFEAPLFSHPLLSFFTTSLQPRAFFTPNRRKLFGFNPTSIHHGTSSPPHPIHPAPPDPSCPAGVWRSAAPAHRQLHVQTLSATSAASLRATGDVRIQALRGGLRKISVNITDFCQTSQILLILPHISSLTTPKYMCAPICAWISHRRQGRKGHKERCARHPVCACSEGGRREWGERGRRKDGEEGGRTECEGKGKLSTFLLA